MGYMQLLMGVVAIASLLIKAISLLISSKTTCNLWHFRPASATGVDAAEKGDTKRLRLEKVPYDLQKRAIMHKRWLMIGHESQWARPGDYRTFTIAEIPFVVIKGEDKKLRAFHNVCRHRAYTVVRKPRGRSLQLFCKYHGWTYDSAGRLRKAPCFPADRPHVLDMRSNGLFEVHLQMDSAGFIFVNFATNLADAFPWSDISPSRLRALDLSTAEEWEMEVDIDWRLASLLPWFIDPRTLSGSSWAQRCLAYLLDAKFGPQLQYVDDASFICSIEDKYHLLISALPMDVKRTVIKMTAIPQTGEAPNARDRERVQRRVGAEIASAMDHLRQHRTANTNLDFRQSAIRERLDKFNRHIYHHKAMEKAAGKKVNAAVRVTGYSDIDVEAERVCSALEGLAADVTTTPSTLVGLEGELEW